MILLISIGPVGERYMVAGLATFPIYDCGVLSDVGIASAYCLPIVVTYVHYSSAIIALSDTLFPFRTNVSDMDPLPCLRPVPATFFVYHH